MSSSVASLDPELLRAFRAAVRARIERDIEAEAAAAADLRERIVPVLVETVREARARGLLGRAWLFGSFAEGTPHPASDVDLLVEACADPLGLAGLLGRVLRRDVHVVEREKAPSSLVARVDAEGQLL